MKFFLSCIFSVTLLSVAIFAADKKTSNNKQKLSPGDKVEVEWAGEKVTADFVEYARTGWITVKFKFNGIEMDPTLPPDKVRLVSKKDKSSDKAGGAKMRTWTDKSGKFKVKAKFIELKDDEVTLETEEGKTVTMALEKLSKADQKAAQDAAKEAEENPFKEKDADENPFEGGTSKAAAEADNEEPSEGDWSGVEQISVNDPGKWSLKPDTAPAMEKLTSKPVILASTLKSKSGGQLGFFEKIEGLLFDRAQGKAYAVIKDRTPGKELDVKLQRVDLVQGKSQDPIPYPSNMKPVDIDPAGEQILARADFMFSPGRNEPAVSVWKLEDKGLKKVKSWSAQEPGNVHKVAPTFAQFVDADHVVTTTFPNKLAMWQVSKAKAVYKMDLTQGGLPALSANRKYMAAPVNNGVFIFDALSGETLGKMPGDPGIVTNLSFRPDGTQLAALSPQRLIVWDLEKGDLYRDIYFSSAIAATKIDWLDKGYLLVGGENLIDLDRRIVLWKYQQAAGGAPAYGEAGGIFWYALTSPDRKERGLFRSRLPHDEALKTAAGLKADDLLVVKPGAQVSLSTNLQGDAAEQQKAVQALTAQLKQLGMNVVNVVNGSPLVLQATTETGKTTQIEYRAFGRLRGSEKANVTEQISRLKFVENNKVIWESVAVSGAPFMLQMKQGETVQQALAPYQKPNLQFFVNAKVPQYVARPNEAGAYGASSLTPQGIQSVPLKAPGVAGR